MGYWSDERDDLYAEMRLINQGALCKSRENAELKDEIEDLKMKIKNMKDEKQTPIPINRDQMSLPFAKWGHGRAMPRADSKLYNETNNENPERES